MYRTNLAFLCHLGYVMDLGKAACGAAACSNESQCFVPIFDTTANAIIQAVYP